MARTAINLYSVRDLSEPFSDILGRAADAGYDGVQLSDGFQDASPEEGRDRMAELDLSATPPHIDIESLEDEVEATLREYEETLGTSSVVVPYLGEEHFESAEKVDETARRLLDLAEALDEYGWDLHYHNHAHEFTDLSGETGLERLLRQTGDDLLLELDVGWALVGGVDPVDFIETYGNRIELLHMKDMVTSEERGFREIGDGDVDMEACAQAGHAAGVDWFIYEHDQPVDPIKSIATGGKFLNKLVEMTA